MSDDELDDEDYQSDDESQSRHGPHKSPKSRPNQASLSTGPRKPAPKKNAQPPPRSVAEPASERRGTPKTPNSRLNRAPPSRGPRKPVPKRSAQQPPHSLSEPASKPGVPHKSPNSWPNQNPERRGPQKQTSQPASALANSSKVGNGPKITAKPLPSHASTGSGKPNQPKPAKSRPIRLSEPQVAKRLKVSPKTLRNWRLTWRLNGKRKGPAIVLDAVG